MAIIYKALYGLKSSGAAWHLMFAGTLIDLQFKSSLADPDMWFREVVKSNGELYYEYIFVYVDDAIILSSQPDNIVKSLSQVYRLKDGSVG